MGRDYISNFQRFENASACYKIFMSMDLIHHSLEQPCVTNTVCRTDFVSRDLAVQFCGLKNLKAAKQLYNLYRQLAPLVFKNNRWPLKQHSFSHEGGRLKAFQMLVDTSNMHSNFRSRIC